MGWDVDRYKNDPLYRYLTNQICKDGTEIERNKEMIKKLVDRQKELKRGRTMNVKLRRALPKLTPNKAE